MLAKIRLYISFLHYLLLVLFGHSPMSRRSVKKAYRHHYELADFFGQQVEQTRTLELIRLAAGRRIPRSLNEFLLVRQLLSARNLKKEIYAMMLNLGDLSPHHLMMSIGLQYQKRRFVYWLAGREQSLLT